MPWKEANRMSLRQEFVIFARQEEANISALCRTYGISRKTAYKWLKRFREGGLSALDDRSRRPHASPRTTPAATEAAALDVREANPAWGGRKIAARLTAIGIPPPAPSTLTAILRRNGRLDPDETVKHKPCHRFERETPNALWQMDFKGPLTLRNGQRCHPLCVLDDHSRFALGVHACAAQTQPHVKRVLTDLFRAYGMPERMLMDNGACWGGDSHWPFTRFTVWLIRLGVSVSHGRPHHPQTQGKIERFHRTLKAEAVGARVFNDLSHCQYHFDWWRRFYNLERPHEALGLLPPAQRYQPSPRPFPETLPPILYGPDDQIRRVEYNGMIRFHVDRYDVGTAFHGLPVALRPTQTDGLYHVYFCHQRIAVIDRKNKTLHKSRVSQPQRLPRGEALGTPLSLDP